jgi:hypothetical protein
MGLEKDYVESIETKQKYDNFSEEVEILAETAAGKMAIYTVKNKNSVTFQKVPGQPGLENRGFMGFVNGDRARPIMLSGSVRTTETETTDNTVTDQFDGASGGGLDLTPSVGWDIQLTASASGFDDSVEEKTSYVIVG